MYEYLQAIGWRRAKIRTQLSKLNTGIIATLLAFVCTASVQAVDLNLVLVDEHDVPVAGAVIEPGGEQTSASPLPSVTVTASTTIAVIDQIDRRFTPMVLMITAGQSVSFPNSDNVRHHVYSFSDIKQFSTPLYADESIEPVLFDKPGIAVLGCNIHDSMVAYVYVSQSSNSAISNEHGMLALNGLSANPGRLSVWHPWLQTPENRLNIDVSTIPDGGELRVSLPVRSPETRFGFRALVPAS
jgi:plastocyanin